MYASASDKINVVIDEINVILAVTIINCLIRSYVVKVTSPDIAIPLEIE